MQRLWRALAFPFTLFGQARRLKERLQSLEAQASFARERLEQMTAEAARVEAKLDQTELRSAGFDGHLKNAQTTLEHMDADLRRIAETAHREAAELSALRQETRDRGREEDHRISSCERRQEGIEKAARAIQGEIDSLKLGLEAQSDRGDTLVDRLAEELEELASLVERMLCREPLPTPSLSDPDEWANAEALERVQPVVLDAFRGPEAEISHRLERHLAVLRDAAPVLDLGSGRGELLLLLREAGVAASGVDADPAMVAASTRRGLKVAKGDVLTALAQQDSDSRGAVTAIHLFEHLPPAALLEVLAEIHRVLRPGGLLLAECPNPHTLRVGSSLYWLDPTHQHPLLPEVLQLWLQTSGFSDSSIELLHPFPAEQCFNAGDCDLPAKPAPGVVELHSQLERLRSRLDELVNGPRDFLITAVKPKG